MASLGKPSLFHHRPRSAVHEGHERRRIALAGDGALRRDLVDAREVGRRELTARRPPGSPRGTSGRFVPGIGTTSLPCASTQASASCAGVQPFSVRDRLDARDEVEVLLRSSRPGSAARSGGSRPAARSSKRLISPVRKPRPSGLYAHEADAELAARREDAVLGVARPERVLALQRAIGWTARGAAERRRSPPRRGRGSEPCPRARAPPSRRPSPRSASRVDAVLVVEVDRVDAEALQARLARLRARSPACR